VVEAAVAGERGRVGQRVRGGARGGQAQRWRGAEVGRQAVGAGHRADADGGSVEANWVGWVRWAGRRGSGAQGRCGHGVEVGSGPWVGGGHRPTSGCSGARAHRYSWFLQRLSARPLNLFVRPLRRSTGNEPSPEWSGTPPAVVVESGRSGWGTSSVVLRCGSRYTSLRKRRIGCLHDTSWSITMKIEILCCPT
jgi:hypothetical protein